MRGGASKLTSGNDEESLLPLKPGHFGKRDERLLRCATYLIATAGAVVTILALVSAVFVIKAVA